MDEIHHFHETFLHPALVKCGHNLNEIGRVFLEYSDNFEIYSIYCRNSKKSEELRRILGRNAFLQLGIHALESRSTEPGSKNNRNPGPANSGFSFLSAKVSKPWT